MGAQCGSVPLVAEELVLNTSASTSEVVDVDAVKVKQAAPQYHSETTSEASTTDDLGSSLHGSSLCVSEDAAFTKNTFEDTFSLQDRSQSVYLEGLGTSLNNGRDKDSEASPSELIASAQRLLEGDGDVVRAFEMLARLQTSLQNQPGGMDEWKALVNTPPVQQIIAECKKMRSIGHSCCSNERQWFNVYTNASGDQTMDACFDPKSPYDLQYRINIAFPVKLTNALAISGEFDLASHWNSLLCGAPKVLQRKKASCVTVCTQVSALAGMIKIENLDEITRYVDEEAGIVVESMCSVREDSPLYFKPSRGFKRTEATMNSLWVACGPDHTIFRQTGTLALPFPLSKMLLNTLSGIVAKYILAGLIRTANRSLEPGNPWEEAIAKDAHDIYRRLDRCVHSDASQRRRPTSGRVVFDASEIAPLLNRYQLQ